MVKHFSFERELIHNASAKTVSIFLTIATCYNYKTSLRDTEKMSSIIIYECKKISQITAFSFKISVKVYKGITPTNEY